MKTNAMQKRNGYLAMGGVGLFLAAGYLAMSFQLPFGKPDQPGAGLFPVVVGILLMVASLATVWEGWRMEKVEQVELPAGADLRRLLCLIGLLFVYFFVMPLLGHFIGSVLFCVFLIRVLSELGWPRIVVYALAMSAVVEVIFVYLLKVPMPRGVLGF